jgi:hypothetical protein
MIDPTVVTYPPSAVRISRLLRSTMVLFGARTTRKSAPPPTPTGRDAARAAPPTAPAAPAKRAYVDPSIDAELVVGSMCGLEAWRRNGHGKRMLSKGPALSPRRLDETSVSAVW